MIGLHVNVLFRLKSFLSRYAIYAVATFLPFYSLLLVMPLLILTKHIMNDIIPSLTVEKIKIGKRKVSNN